MQRLRALAIVLLCLGAALLLLLFWQFTDVYFVLGGDGVDPTAGQESRYLWTASACVAAMFGAAACGTLANSKVWGPLGGIGVVLAVVAAIVLAVPTDRWVPDPAPNELPSNYEPCFSGSNDCGPGG
ncbi:hypothetical protein [Aeromicrobium sp. UC242_57]|uniref:hypothetical protein n=1 Tax=Aeromicrobium sp. UC242_57 TaxID=3374624 RepID=UPI003792C8CB